eukprot:TRINITY_DN2697_c0_g1_i5.p1 TRINITY_DN2697_c0_g1~~TRINITY_DN2697_c0_g1_i5.p1  ORF type:complete len:111 (+),score=23.88 TRINITY_DN2697_c0_g1_i5:456-788(+)
MTSSYFGGANACLVVFDVTSKESLENVDRWIGEAKKFSDKSRPLSFYILGNKIDQKDQRICDRGEGESIAKRAKGTYFEVSAKTGEEIQNTFRTIGETLYNKNNGTLDYD